MFYAVLSWPESYGERLVQTRKWNFYQEVNTLDVYRLLPFTATCLHLKKIVPANLYKNQTKIEWSLFILVGLWHTTKNGRAHWYWSVSLLLFPRRQLPSDKTTKVSSKLYEPNFISNTYVICYDDYKSLIVPYYLPRWFVLICLSEKLSL